MGGSGRAGQEAGELKEAGIDQQVDRPAGSEKKPGDQKPATVAGLWVVGHVSFHPGSLWCSHFMAKEFGLPSRPGGASLPYLASCLGPDWRLFSSSEPACPCR